MRRKMLALFFAVVVIALTAQEITGGYISKSLDEFTRTFSITNANISNPETSTEPLSELVNEPSATTDSVPSTTVPATVEPVTVTETPEPATNEPVNTDPVSTESVEPEISTEPASEEVTETEEPLETENADVPVKVLDVTNIQVELNEYGFELPINGATGFVSVDMTLVKDDGNEIVEAGTPFTIISEEKDKWFVKIGEDKFGWLESKYCFINLVDVIPSIIYNNTNSYSSEYRSLMNDIEGITNEQLYNSYYYSNRFSEDQFIVPVLYTMSKNIAMAQQKALADGNTLVIYEGYRPYETQMQVCAALKALANSNAEVAKHINNYTWNISWFIATGVSNHQRGYAIDVSLAKITEAEYKKTGEYEYISIVNYDEYEMPTPIHELSDLSVTFQAPVSSISKTDWQYATLASTFNESAKLLQDYCTSSGLTPLSSEWWHFNDLSAKDIVGNNRCTGNFFITGNCSTIPE